MGWKIILDGSFNLQPWTPVGEWRLWLSFSSFSSALVLWLSSRTHVQVPHSQAVTLFMAWFDPDLSCAPYPPKQQHPTAFITALRYQCLLSVITLCFVHSRSAADTSNFDFNDDSDAPTTTPRRPPGASFLQGSNSRELKGSGSISFWPLLPITGLRYLRLRHFLIKAIWLWNWCLSSRSQHRQSVDRVLSSAIFLPDSFYWRGDKNETQAVISHILFSALGSVMSRDMLAGIFLPWFMDHD